MFQEIKKVDFISGASAFKFFRKVSKRKEIEKILGGGSEEIIWESGEEFF